MLYFAYGSNLHTNRLQARVPSAVKVTDVQLPDTGSVFTKEAAINPPNVTS